jgi:hypothetical protein
MSGTMADMDVQDQSPQTPAAEGGPAVVDAAQDAVEEEWPPRAWRETTRAAGHRQALYVTLAMLVMFGVLAGVAIWASHNG